MTSHQVETLRRIAANGGVWEVAKQGRRYFGELSMGRRAWFRKSTVRRLAAAGLLELSKTCHAGAEGSRYNVTIAGFAALESAW